MKKRITKSITSIVLCLLISKVPYIPTSDMIAPKYIAVKDSKYIVVDGKYYSFLYLTSEGYPSLV